MHKSTSSRTQNSTHLSNMLSFVVIGDPAPQGSKRAFVRGGKAVIVEDAKGHKDWRAAVTSQVMQQLVAYPEHEPMKGAIDIELVFKMRRPKTVTRNHPYVAPDLDKLCRHTLCLRLTNKRRSVAR